MRAVALAALLLACGGPGVVEIGTAPAALVCDEGSRVCPRDQLQVWYGCGCFFAGPGEQGCRRSWSQDPAACAHRDCRGDCLRVELCPGL